MCNNGIVPRLALGKHNNGVVKPEPGPRDRLSLSIFPVIQVDKLFTQSAGVTGTDRLGLAGGHAAAEPAQLVQELAHFCQIAWAAYDQGQRLNHILRPLLPRTTWHQATEVARRGGHALPNETVEASILWLDIASFTELVDTHPLEEVLPALNTFLDTLTQLVYRYNGDVNKYLGDGFLAVFPDADDAVQAGCAMQKAAADFNHHQLAQGGLAFPTRIGIATGQVATASLGSCERQDRTVIGMPVILAGRLQEGAPPGRVWLSEATFERLRDRSGCRAVGPVRVKGLQEPVDVYEK